jgi:hypothetical protein
MSWSYLTRFGQGWLGCVGAEASSEKKKNYRSLWLEPSLVWNFCTLFESTTKVAVKVPVELIVFRVIELCIFFQKFFIIANGKFDNLWDSTLTH